MDIKPGHRTTEFAFAAVITAVLGVLKIYGVVTDAEATAWSDFLLALVPVAYIWSRTQVKRGG